MLFALRYLQQYPVHIHPGEFFDGGQEYHVINLSEKYTKVNTTKIYEIEQFYYKVLLCLGIC